MTKNNFKNVLRAFLAILVILGGAMPVAAQQDVYGFRGKARDGIYETAEKLPESWPADGLPVAWTSQKAGKGYSTPIAAGGKVYVTGLADDEKREMLTAFDDADGKVLWQTPFGEAWNGGYSDSRASATVAGNEVYVESGKPELVCIDATTGKIKWSIDAVKSYNRKPNEFGPAESPLVVGQTVYFSTMSDKAALIAVDRMSGKVLWETPPYNDTLMYASPIMIEHGGKKQIVVLSRRYAVGINADDGSVGWKINVGEIVKKGQEGNRFTPHFINTPIFRDGLLCITASYNYGTMLFRLNGDATGAELVWLNRDLDPHHGGTVLVDGYLYGSSWTNNKQGGLVRVDWTTGKTVYDAKLLKGDENAIISSGGMLYCFDDRQGNMSLVRPGASSFDITGSFKFKGGSGPFWAHPAIAGRRLYVRHGDTVTVFELKIKN